MRSRSAIGGGHAITGSVGTRTRETIGASRSPYAPFDAVVLVAKSPSTTGHVMRWHHRVTRISVWKLVVANEMASVTRTAYDAGAHHA